MSLLVVEGASVTHRERGRVVEAVRGVTFSVGRGERVGLVGPSGCGKSTLLRAVVGLEGLSAGRITFDGQPVHGAPASLRARYQPMFQDSLAALDPRMTLGQSLAEPLVLHRRPHGPAQLGALMESVQLPPALLERRPREVSQGQRQRLNLARALALGPELLVLDEPVSALDVSVQAQVVVLLEQLLSARGTALLLVSHDRDVVARLCPRVLTMDAGRVIEQA